MQYARALLESRPFLSRIPDQSLIAADSGEGAHHVQATRDSAGTYALVYLPAGDGVELDLSPLTADKLLAYWFDPRTGVAQRIGILQRQDRMHFTPPDGGLDWVLALEDPAAGYPAPGSRPLLG